MKTIFWISILMMVSTLGLQAQTPTGNTQTDTLTVSGNCGQCKERIEEAAYIKGVKHAEWNKKNQVLTLVYNKAKTSLEQIASAIARAGHDNRLHNADDTHYAKLPSCCAYRTGSCDHD